MLNKYQGWRQIDAVIRVERQHKVMEDEYACCLRRTMMNRNQRVCEYFGYLDEDWERYWVFIIWRDVYSNYFLLPLIIQWHLNLYTLK